MGDVRKIYLEQLLSEVEMKKKYQVTKLVNSADYSIGEELNEMQVKDLCNLSTWQVEIK